MMKKSLKTAVESRRRLAERSMTERSVNVIAGLLGVVFVLAGVLCRSGLGELLSTAVISIGASIIASSIVAYLTSIYLFRMQREKALADEWGLDSICGQRAVMNEAVDERFDLGVKSLDIFAYGLKSFRESRDDAVRRQLRAGMSMRILTVNPDNPLLASRDAAENRPAGSTADSILKLKKWAEGLEGEFGQSVSIRMSDILPTELIFRVDEKLYIGPYQTGRESQQSITYEFHEGGKGFSYYKSYFEKLWEDALDETR